MLYAASHPLLLGIRVALRKAELQLCQAQCVSALCLHQPSLAAEPRLPHAGQQLTGIS